MDLRRSRALLALLAAAALASACRSNAAAPARPATATSGAVPGALAAHSDGGAPLPLDAGIVHGELANGLTYYVRRNLRPAKRAELWLVVDAGAAIEDDDQRGVAHILEHMAFNGTRKYAKQEIVNWMEKAGMRFGADLNASTSFDETIYKLQVPTDDPALFAHGLDILHEWAGAVTLDPADVAAERGVVLSERRSGRGVAGRMLDAIVPAALPGSIYGARLPIGTADSLESMSVDRLRRFYRDWYRPDLMAVIVVGDVEPAAVEAQLKATFADLPRPASPRPRPTIAVPPHPRPVTLTVKDPEMPVTAVAVLSKQPRRVPRSEGDYRAQTVERLFTLLLNQRLTEAGRKPDAPFLGAQVASEAILRPIDVWFQLAIVKGDRATDALTALSTELARVARFGFTDSEVARGKDELLRAHQAAVKEKDKTESRDHVEELVRVFLTGESAPGVAAELAVLERALPTITAAEIQAVAARANATDNRVILALGNKNAALPDQAALLAAVAAGGAAATTAYVDDVAKGPLVASPPKAGKVVKERTIEAIGVTEWTLANGARVVVKPTDFDNDKVAISAYALGGSSTAREADFVAAEQSAAVALAGGSGELTADQIAKALTGTGVSIMNFVNRYDQTFVGGSRADHLAKLFELAYLQLTAPRKDAAAIEAWRAQEVEARRRQLDEPETVFAARVREALTGKHPRTRLLTSEDFERLDADRAIALYRERFGHGKGLTVVVVGNFTLEAIRPLVETWIGGLPAGKATRWRDIGVRRPRGEARVEVVQGIEPKARVELVFHRKERWTSAAQTDVVALGEVLSIVLRESLREEMGATYGVAVSGQFVREPRPEALIDIQFGCAPDSVEPTLARVRAQIAELQQSGPSPDVLARVQQTARREREVALARNSFWLDHLTQAFRHGDDPAAALADHLRQIEALTPDRLRAAARRYLGKDVVIGTLRPAALAPRR